MGPVSWGCHHRVPPTGQLKTTETPLSVLKDRSLKTQCGAAPGSLSALPSFWWLLGVLALAWLTETKHSGLMAFSSVCPVSNPPVFMCLYGCVYEGAGRELHHVSVSITANLTRSFVYGGRADICHGALVGIRGLLESVFSFHCMSPGDQTQVMGLSGKRLSLWSHLISPW